MAEAIQSLERYRELVGDWQAFAEACSRPLPTVIWANPLRQGALGRLSTADGLSGGSPGEQLAARLASRGYRCEAVEWCPGALRVPGLQRPGVSLEYYLGIYHVQEEISMAPAVALDPRPGERVLDLCAAPGGKTTQLGVRMQNRGTLVANDVRPGRLRALRANCERLGLLNVAVTHGDGTRFPLEAGPFHRILLDAPCSCEGNVREFGGSSWEGREAEPISGRAGLQATLLGRAWKLLRPGGTLLYATCTFAPEENEMVLDHVLKDDAAVVACQIPGLRAAPGVTEWEGRSLRPDCTNVARYWPHLNDTGGFTMAAVRKATS